MEHEELDLELLTEIVTSEDTLRIQSMKVKMDHPKAKDTIDRVVKALKEAMHKGWTTGYGLAAIQIGVPLQIAYYCIPTEDAEAPIERILINPKVTKLGPIGDVKREGCLSIPNQSFDTRRHKAIGIENTTIEGEVEHLLAVGLEAVCIQHEMDHMEGKICSDRVRPGPFVSGRKVGRNDPCPCGSEKKYKKCCLNPTPESEDEPETGGDNGQG